MTYKFMLMTGVQKLVARKSSAICGSFEKIKFVSLHFEGKKISKICKGGVGTLINRNHVLEELNEIKTIGN